VTGLGPFKDFIELIPWAVGIVLAVAAFMWIRRIVKDIEDN
jgi:hypothetical protein